MPSPSRRSVAVRPLLAAVTVLAGCSGGDQRADRLAVTISAPEEAELGQVVTVDLIVTNRGSEPAEGVLLKLYFDSGLEHATGGGSIEQKLPDLPPGQAQTVDAKFRAAGLAPRVAMEMSSPEAIKKLVAVGLGAATLPSRSVTAEIRSGVLAPLRVAGGNLVRVLGVVRDGRRTSSPAAAGFLELAERIRNVSS